MSCSVLRRTMVIWEQFFFFFLLIKTKDHLRIRINERWIVSWTMTNIMREFKTNEWNQQNMEERSMDAKQQKLTKTFETGSIFFRCTFFFFLILERVRAYLPPTAAWLTKRKRKKKEWKLVQSFYSMCLVMFNEISVSIFVVPIWTSDVVPTFLLFMFLCFSTLFTCD